MVDQISGISSRLSAYGMGSGDQRGAQALALRAMTQANKDIRSVETDVINRIAKIDQAIAEEDSAIAGELARMDLAKSKQQAEIANQARRRQQAYTQQLVNLGGQAVAMGIEELGPGLEDKMETKAAMTELDEAFQDDTAELAYFDKPCDTFLLNSKAKTSSVFNFFAVNPRSSYFSLITLLAAIAPASLFS